MEGWANGHPVPAARSTWEPMRREPMRPESAGSRQVLWGLQLAGALESLGLMSWQLGGTSLLCWRGSWPREEGRPVKGISLLGGPPAAHLQGTAAVSHRKFWSTPQGETVISPAAAWHIALVCRRLSAIHVPGPEQS